MNVWRSASGMLDVELTSAEVETALDAINASGIAIYHLQQISELTCCFQIARTDYDKLNGLCQKRGETLRILRRAGIYWVMKSLLGRPVMLVGLILFFFLVISIPTRVFFVRVEGNSQVADKRILAAAERCGICFGASRKEVRSEKVKNSLLAAVPELQWAGVNTSGCVATISVRERSNAETEEKEKTVGNVVAARDGYILSGTVIQGNAVFEPGQTVKAGQILISGYTDCGICIRATQAEGEVFAQTSRNLEAVTLSESMQRLSLQGKKRKISLLFRKKRINLWKDSGISDSSCGRMYKEYYITLPGGFQLPIALCVETYLSYTTQTADVLQADAEKRLDAFAEEYLKQQMIAGEISSKVQTTLREDGFYRLTGIYVCTEMISREQQEQIGDTNGKIS